MKRKTKLRLYLVPVGTMIGMILLIGIVGNFFWNQSQKTQSELTKANTERKVLADRLDVLQANRLSVQESQSIVTTALPVRNPAVLVLNQIFRLRDTYDVSVEDLAISDLSRESRNITDVNFVNIEFTISGNYTQVTGYIADLKEVSPIVNIDELKLENQIRNMKAEISLTSFYADVPDTIPAITTPLDDLDETEKAVISLIKEYAQPSVTTLEAPIKPEGKFNPFQYEGFDVQVEN